MSTTVCSPATVSNRRFACSRAAAKTFWPAFGPDRFDFVYARNSIDHSADPARVVRNMLLLARPGGFVILRHWRNEGLKAEYEELHQWNVDLADGELVLWNARHRHTLSELADGLKLDRDLVVEHDQVIAVLRRGPPGGPPPPRPRG